MTPKRLEELRVEQKRLVAGGFLGGCSMTELLDYIDQLEIENGELSRIVHDAILDDRDKEAIFQRGRDSLKPVLEKVEWQGLFHFTDDEPLCCPHCHGIHPGDGPDELAQREKSYGHPAIYHASVCPIGQLLGRTPTRDFGDYASSSQEET